MRLFAPVETMVGMGAMRRGDAVMLWLLVIFGGIQFGAGWYEKLAIVPLWADLSPDQVLDGMSEWGMQRASFVIGWTGLNYGRMVIGGIGWLCLLRALSLSAIPPRAGGAMTRCRPYVRCAL